jgi:hypothetical protein
MSTAGELSDERGSRLVGDEIVERVSKEQRAEAELRRLAHTLREGRLKDAPDAADEWAKRRGELLGGPDQDRLSTVDQRMERLAASIGELLRPWEILDLPYMYEGINESPGGGATGSIATAGLYAGGLGFGGTLEPAGSHEQWWIHNWRNSCVFPAAPYKGRLYYRFAVDTECHVYRAPVYSGSIMEFVTIGTTSDVASSPLDQWTTWQTVGWPVNESLPSTNLNLGGSVPVAGSIPVEAGKHAALGFIYGCIISAAGGYVQLLWGNFGARRTLPASSTIGYQDYDKVEFRFEPGW